MLIRHKYDTFVQSPFGQASHDTYMGLKSFMKVSTLVVYRWVVFDARNPRVVAIVCFELLRAHLTCLELDDNCSS